MNILLSIRNTIQNNLFPYFEEVPEPLSEKEQRFIQVVTLMNPQKHMSNYKRKGNGRKPEDRVSLLKAFIAETVYNYETTEMLIENLKNSENLRKKGGVVPPEPLKRPDIQPFRTPEENLADLPKKCDIWTKKDSKGHKTSRNGCNLHIDTIDGDIPVSAVLTSASLHDSQVAIPLAQMTAQHIVNLYDLTDSAYDAAPIKDVNVPIIEHNPRRGEKREMSPAEKTRYAQRSSAERVSSNLEDNHGGSRIRVRGSAKIMTQLMSGLIVITAIQLIRLTVQLQYDREHPVCLTSGKRVKAEVFPFFAFLTEC